MRALMSIGMIVIIIAVLVLAVKSVKVEGTESNSATANTMNNNSPAASTPQATSSSDFKIEDLKVGSGTEAVSGKTVAVNYVGTLLNGTKFDSSYDRNQSFTFNLGAGQVIKGWDQGVVGMKVGGKRKLTIPPQLGYGEAGAPPVIPGNATLIFEVELLRVE